MSKKLKSGFVYILSNQPKGILYIGVTSNLPQRISEHKIQNGSGFSKKYNTCLLVYYECHNNIESAIIREKQLKKWNRAWKVRLIEENNSEWIDLFPALIE